jgi:methyl-accepting chemotaxis protein
MVEPVSADRRDGILRQRAAADQDFSEALESLRGIPEMKGGEKALVEAEQAFRSYASFRQEVDENLNRRLADRAGGVAREFMPTITGLIERIGTLRLTLETLAVAPSADLVQLVQLRALASEMAEYAGRERGLFSALVSSEAIASDEDLQSVAYYRGHVELAWATVRAARLRTDLPSTLLVALDEVETAYFGRFQESRNLVHKGAVTGQYPFSSDEWMTRATAAIDTMLKLNNEIGQAAEAMAEETFARSQLELLAAVAVFGIALVSAAVSFWLVFRRIVGPLVSMTDAMHRLADGDKSIEIEGAERADGPCVQGEHDKSREAFGRAGSGMAIEGKARPDA